jgi:hypothetical protein
MASHFNGHLIDRRRMGDLATWAANRTRKIVVRHRDILGIVIFTCIALYYISGVRIRYPFFCVPYVDFVDQDNHDFP